MKPHEIRALLIKRQIKQKEIADELGLKECSVSGAISGRWQSRRVCEAIAKRLDMPLKRLFPKLAA